MSKNVSNKYGQKPLDSAKTTGCLLDYSYFKEKYRMIGIDLSKQQTLDTDPRGIPQIILQQI